MFLVCGSQADRADRNKVTLLKLTDLHKTHQNADSDDEASDAGDDLDEEPTLEHINVDHNGGINRIRSMPQAPGIVASMSDTGAVNVFDLSITLQSMQVKGPTIAPNANSRRPLFSFRGHRAEGYAIDWSPLR